MKLGHLPMRSRCRNAGSPGSSKEGTDNNGEAGTMGFASTLAGGFPAPSTAPTAAVATTGVLPATTSDELFLFQRFPPCETPGRNDLSTGLISALHASAVQSFSAFLAFFDASFADSSWPSQAAFVCPNNHIPSLPSPGSFPALTKRLSHSLSSFCRVALASVFSWALFSFTSAPTAAPSPPVVVGIALS